MEVIEVKEWIMEQLGGEPLRKENRADAHPVWMYAWHVYERERSRIAHTDQ